MLPRDLKPEMFSGYPPEARKIITNYVATLQRLPLSFVPGLLRELINFDFKFPAERKVHERELDYLGSLSAAQLIDWFQGFSRIRLSPELEQFDWVKAPAQFVERLSAHLWTTHQLDAFRQASNDYADRLHAAVPPEAPPVPRLGISVIGQGVASYGEPLFRKLRTHGAYFTHVKAENGLRQLLDGVAARARSHPVPYGHWYIDGGMAAECDPSLVCISYEALAPVRAALLARMQEEINRPGMGPEALRTLLARMRPADLGMEQQGSATPKDEVLQRFEVSVLTEGSGTQIFSTVFAQWAAREALRRAQPLTLLVRFAPRQRQRPMNEMLSARASVPPELDVIGSLVDGDFGAYYNWLNQQRLPGAEQSCFLVWFEGHNQALAIGPSMARGTESNSAADLQQVLTWIL
ncbi:MAG TPA: hypothetical protein VFA67_11080 [Candidatus Sulfotelmatobacter sp.]|nr:hypothetical protein [Candidatus Sulfotelmatobacter sp.]